MHECHGTCVEVTKQLHGVESLLPHGSESPGFHSKHFATESLFWFSCLFHKIIQTGSIMSYCVFIWISLENSDIGHLFWFSWVFIYLLCENSHLYSSPFSIFRLDYLIFASKLHKCLVFILECYPLIGYIVYKYFPQLHGSPFHCADCYFCLCRSFSLQCSSTSAFLLVAYVLWCPFKGLLQPSDCQGQWILPTLSLAF